MSTLINRYGEKIVATGLSIRPFVPFVVLNTVRRVLDPRGKTMLDIGCGDGTMIRTLLKSKNLWILGTDISLEPLKASHSQKAHDDHVLGDARSLPFRDNSFDIVMAVEIIEHMEKTEGYVAIRKWESLANCQIIISTPVGECRIQSNNGNSYDEHKSAWYPRDFKTLGYQVRGHGLRQMYGDSGLFARSPRIIQPLLFIISFLVGPIVYFIPQYSGRMVCMKKKQFETGMKKESVGNG